MADIKELSAPPMATATPLQIDEGGGRQRARTFSFDGKFLKKEAREALRSYFLPFSGIYAAVTGRDVVFVRRDKDGHFVRERKTRRRS